MEYLGVILGAGGVAFLGAMVEAYRRLKEGARAREREAINNLEKWTDQSALRAQRALNEADYQRALVSYWQGRSGTLEYQVGQLGGVVPPAPPLPAPPPDPTISGAPHA